MKRSSTEFMNVGSRRQRSSPRPPGCPGRCLPKPETRRSAICCEGRALVLARVPFALYEAENLERAEGAHAEDDEDAKRVRDRAVRVSSEHVAAVHDHDEEDGENRE